MQPPGVGNWVCAKAGKPFVLDLHSSDSVEFVKQQIQDREGIPPSQQRLLVEWATYNSARFLEDEHLLSECGNLARILSNRLDIKGISLKVATLNDFCIK